MAQRWYANEYFNSNYSGHLADCLEYSIFADKCRKINFRSQFLNISNEIAQDVDFEEVKEIHEPCSGHECHLRRTGVVCSVCRNFNT